MNIHTMSDKLAKGEELFKCDELSLRCSGQLIEVTLPVNKSHKCLRASGGMLK